ncbi:MAG: hypothetical protein ACI9W2_001367, partial [Gammaproteobacteria bacterium]
VRRTNEINGRVLPPRSNRFAHRETLIIGNAEHGRWRLLVWHMELVQVIVEPTHRILNGDMQLPERIPGRHQQFAPDGRRNPQEFDAKSQNIVPSINPCAAVFRTRAPLRQRLI